MQNFWDIIPPEEYQKNKLENKKEKPVRKKRSYKGIGFFALLILIIGAVSFVTFKMSKAEIKIWPKTETIKLSSNFTVDVNRLSVNHENKSVPGEIIEKEKLISEDFPCTGSVFKKAEGVIRLYNEYSTRSETWLEGTRFVSEDGKIFKSKSSISVPGAEMQNQKVVAQYIDVPVVAAEAGGEYNIEPSSFSIYV